jgi:hypothetical protein
LEIRGLTVRRPWAACIASGMKSIENRSWRTSYRGLLAIHSSAGPFEETALFSNAVLEALSRAPGRSFHKGVIVATARLAGCHRAQSAACDSPWCDPDALWHWEFAEIRPLDLPISAKGALGLWRLLPETFEPMTYHLDSEGVRP